MFHTEAYKKNGWDECNLSKHPFFENECEDKDDHTEMSEDLKKIFETAIFGALKAVKGKRKNEQEN